MRTVKTSLSITRNGIIEPSWLDFGHNRCGHNTAKALNYTAVVQITPSAGQEPELDAMGFLIDHNEIDMLAKASVTDTSCENNALQICDSLTRALSEAHPSVNMRISVKLGWAGGEGRSFTEATVHITPNPN